MQGNYTEIFGFVAQDVSKALAKIAAENKDEDQKKVEDSPKSLVQLVREESDIYCTKDEAVESVTKIVELVKAYSFSDEINEIFDIKIHSEVDSNYPISTDYIGETLNVGNHEYMIDIETETRTRRVPKNKLLSGLAVFLSEADKVTEKYQAPAGASSTVDLPFRFISIRFMSKFPNVNDAGCVISPFVSQTKIIVFSALYFYKAREWDVKTIDHASVKWANFEEYIKLLSWIWQKSS